MFEIFLELLLNAIYQKFFFHFLISQQLILKIKLKKKLFKDERDVQSKQINCHQNMVHST